MARLLILAFLFAAAAAAVSAAALTPDGLTPAEKKAYAIVSANPRAAKRYLATRDYLRLCDAVHADNSKAAALPVQPAEVTERYLNGAERKRVDDAVDLSIAVQLSGAGVTLEPIDEKPIAAPTMTAETAAFLTSAGFDPKSTDIAQIHSEGPVETTYQDDPQTHSLDTLAAGKAKNALKRFITTRGFIRALKANFAETKIPAEGYDGLYLTLDERTLALKKVFPE